MRILDKSDDIYPFVDVIKERYDDLEQIRIYVLTDKQAKSTNFKSREEKGKTLKLEVMDIGRLYRHMSEGKPRDEIRVDFGEVCGTALPCVYVPGVDTSYDYALTVIPGEVLKWVYDKYGARLLEANVRSFLNVTGKVNKGIRNTLIDAPEMFIAYNNGIVLIVDEISLGKGVDGSTGILWLKGMQIVNGGQTTASLYFSKKKNPEINLGKVRVPAKIIVIHSGDSLAEDELISSISRYANSQNVVRQADLSANKPFHIAIEKLASTVYCPDGKGRWFYERAAGSYNVMLSRETPARQKQIKETIPNSRKITKTDLAKYMNAWDQKPYIVSLGAQKNFSDFMKSLDESSDNFDLSTIDVTFYKKLIARAIIFNRTQKLVRSSPSVTAFQANITSYLVSLLSYKVGGMLDMEMVWKQQGLSSNLEKQLLAWAKEVNEKLHQSAKGRMISEWAKRPECWNVIKSNYYSELLSNIPELKPLSSC